MVKQFSSKILINNMLRLTSLIACLAGLLCAVAAKATGRHGREVSQIAMAIFFLDPTLKLWASPSAWEASASGGRRPALSGLHLIKFLLIQR